MGLSKRRRVAQRGLAVALAAPLAGGCGFNANDPLAGLPTLSQDRAPPAVSGGTLRISSDGRTAIASDPDRDAVYLVELATGAVRTVPLGAGAEPFRIAEGSQGRAHVVLRGAGAVATIDVATGVVLERRSVCSAPRGIDHEAEGDRLWVACARGEVVVLPAVGTGEVLTFTPGGELRDVVVHAGRVYVSRFRSGAIVPISLTGYVGRAVHPPVVALTSATGLGTRRFQSSVAWRLRGGPMGPLMVHQRGFIGPEETATSGSGYYAMSTGATGSVGSYSYSRSQRGYIDPCDNAVTHGAVTPVLALTSGAATSSTVNPPSITRGVLPVDVAASPQGQIAVALAGELGSFRLHGPQVALFPAARLVSAERNGCIAEDRARRYPGQVVAVDFAGETLVVQTREPANLVVGERVIPLSAETRRDTGHDFFHADLGGGIACASCHPEGGDDAHVWDFRETGPRRTQSLLGGVRPEGPYHWRGDVPTLRALMDNTMNRRMNGPVLDEDQFVASRRWMERLPAIAPSHTVVPSQVDRGRAVFERADVGCANCHAGSEGSDGLHHVVNGVSWRTPALRGVAARAPYFHDGCAASLRVVLRGCGSNTRHGNAALLPTSEQDDLIGYLKSL